MTIAVIGAGYVGLPSAAVFAKLGHTVWLLRRDEKKMEELRQGILPFYEPGLPELVQEGVAAGRLHFTTDYRVAIPDAEIIFICVGTPPLPSGEADLSQVFTAAGQIAKQLKHYAVIVDKSTVPVGTAEKVRKVIEEVSGEFDVASCPEFLREGVAVGDAFNPDRIVIGADTQRARAQLLKVHDGLPGERVVTDIRTAEMIKYASNAFLATKISFMNEIANLCDGVGANVDDVARGMGHDKRIGSAFLKAGIGYGGSCFPKDTKALRSIALDHHYDFKLLKAVIEVNAEQRKRFFEKIKTTLGELRGKRIAVLGLAFKNNTDDVRESAALDVVRWLLEAGAAVVAYDPKADVSAKRVLPQLVTTASAAEALTTADTAIILTEWEEFRDLPWVELKTGMRSAIVFDGRNLLDPQIMRAAGFQYHSVGRA